MTRHVFTFLATFVLGALIALAARTAFHQPHAAPAAADHVPAPAAPPAAGDHSHQAAKPPAAATPAVAAKPPVNTVCAICGMNVDPRLPTAEYQGQTIGFGCRMCPPKFKADPDKYGPSYLRNEVIAK